MERVDAKAELDDLYGGLSDVVHYIGTVLHPALKDRPIAFVRLIFDEDGPMCDWPKYLTHRVAVDVRSGVEMFIICEPGKPMEPLIATEWTDSYANFVSAANARGVFFVEIVTPKRKRQAVVVHDEVKEIREVALTPEDYEFLKQANVAPEQPPQS